ncbi:MAG: phosphotransferase family protein [Methanosarcinales archaeon]
MDDGDVIQMELRRAEVERYLRERFGDADSTGEHDITLESVSELGTAPGEVMDEGVKGFGYGRPYLIRFRDGDREESVVLSTMRVQPGFGHDHFSDRAQVLLWQHDTFNRLPRHVRALDVGYFTRDGRLYSAGRAEEFFILMENVTGTEYVNDLEQIKKNDGKLTKLDIERAEALSEYLARIHKKKHTSPELYHRKIRDTIGHGECIMGLTDSYPENLEYITPQDLCRIEEKCVEWRWKIKNHTERLCMTHGDFHPYNIIFREGTDFTVLDRSRGEWGEAADDVSSLTMNYIFYALQTHGAFTGGFRELFETFFKIYLEETGDTLLLRVIQPFFVFRALVVASPIWYPKIPPETRKKLFNFIRNILATDEFRPEETNKYLEKEY